MDSTALKPPADTPPRPTRQPAEGPPGTVRDFTAIGPTEARETITRMVKLRRMLHLSHEATANQVIDAAISEIEKARLGTVSPPEEMATVGGPRRS